MSKIQSLKKISYLNPLSPSDFNAIDICPICKKSVKINRHNLSLCAEICKRQKAVEKAAQRAIKIEQDKRRPKRILKETN